MGGRSRPTESLKTTEQPMEKKKGFTDWMNLVKPGNEEKDHWVISFLEEKCLYYFIRCLPSLFCWDSGNDYFWY